MLSEKPIINVIITNFNINNQQRLFLRTQKTIRPVSAPKPLADPHQDLGKFPQTEPAPEAVPQGQEQIFKRRHEERWRHGQETEAEVADERGAVLVRIFLPVFEEQLSVAIQLQRVQLLVQIFDEDRGEHSEAERGFP